jgi:hypothetical protein
MKIFSVHNSNDTPGVQTQFFARESGLLRCHGHQVLLYQSIPTVQTVPVGIWE